MLLDLSGGRAWRFGAAATAFLSWVGLRIIFIFRVLLNTYANQNSLTKRDLDGRDVDESHRLQLGFLLIYLFCV